MLQVRFCCANKGGTGGFRRFIKLSAGQTRDVHDRRNCLN